MRLAVILSLGCLGTAAGAIEVEPNGARLTASEGPIAESVILPRAAYAPDAAPTGVSGMVTRRAWRLPGRSDTPLQAAAPIEAQLEAEGYDIVFTCSDNDCGGFDFRFQLSLLPAPGMFVDLGNYRYVLAERQVEGQVELVSIVTSRAGDAGTLHLTEVVPLGAATVRPEGAQPDPSAPVAVLLDPSPTPVDTSDFIASMVARGHAVLPGIDFPSGAASLPSGDYSALTDLAGWMEEASEARIVLVGHTDAVGSLEANTDLSRRRAASVAARMIELAPGIAARVSSAGAGYLSPVASNLTEAGRAANRRVEVVLLSR